MRTRHFVFLITLALLPSAVLAQHDHPAIPEKLGTVKFTTSCSPAMQPQFNRAVALMHSFQFAPAIAAFHVILDTDSSCSMAWWGIALSNWGNPFGSGLKPQTQLEHGLRAINQARALHPKTEREQAYIEAVAHLFTGTANIDQRTRIIAYESAMKAVSEANPDDTEAAIFYALAIAAAADPADKTYARQLQAGKILEALYAQHPDHPGLAHYIIHAYDVPSLAARAAAAAQHYSEIAPSTPHALHMPSHTFTRVGDWQASINANIASAASARSAGQPAEELHASDYLTYAYLQIAQDKAAQQVAFSAADIFAHYDSTVALSGAAGPAAAYFARAAVPARYCLERHDWADAAKLEPIPSPFPYTDAMTYFARGLGASHIKDTAAAQSAVASLRDMHDKLVIAKEAYWAYQVEIQRQEVAAWLAFAQGHFDSALAGMSSAAELEDKTEKNAITPGPLAPARELLGDLLLELGRPAEALKEYEATLVHEPNRFRSLYGAAHAAKLTGDQATSKTYFQKLLQIAEHADQPGRPELVEARGEAVMQK